MFRTSVSLLPSKYFVHGIVHCSTSGCFDLRGAVQGVMSHLRYVTYFSCSTSCNIQHSINIIQHFMDVHHHCSCCIEHDIKIPLIYFSLQLFATFLHFMTNSLEATSTFLQPSYPTMFRSAFFTQPYKHLPPLTPTPPGPPASSPCRACLPPSIPPPPGPTGPAIPSLYGEKSEACGDTLHPYTHMSRV